jgi:hypothetical protein
MKNFDIVKWAKEEQLAQSKMDANSKYVARYIECTLLPKLEEVFHTPSNNARVKPCKKCTAYYGCIGCRHAWPESRFTTRMASPVA